MDMGSLADGYGCDLTIDGSSLRETCEALLEALGRPPWPALTAWASPSDAAPRSSPLPTALAAGEVEDQVEWHLGDAATCFVSERVEGVYVRVTVFDTARERAWRWLVALEELLARLLRRLAIREGLVQREGAGVRCVPTLPLVGGPSYLVVTHDAALLWAFQDPGRVIAEGGWDEKEINGYRLLARAMRAETNVELLEAIQDGQWAMARLVRPGKARYRALGVPTPEEEAIFRAGDARVLAAGYDVDAQTARFSCALGADEHVRGWEIAALQRIVSESALATGEVVERVEVVFPERETARRERRPLMDVGVHVLYYDGVGGLAEIAD